MKVLVLGGAGMLGHKLWQVASTRFETYATVRGTLHQSPATAILDQARTVEHVTAERLDTVTAALDTVRPDVVVNCIGIVKQRENASDAIASITVNALFPHQLAALCRARAARLIHISTDCVFSGKRGRYTEADPADPEDLYGRSKLLGETARDGCLTVRCSMIGRELGTAYGLLEWFLSQRGGTVRGFRHAIFSGMTTLELSRIVCEIVEWHPGLGGLWHVAAEPISKLDLLRLIRERFSLPVTIEPHDLPAIDRSLDGRRFCDETGLVAAGWPDMIQQLAEDRTPYGALAVRS